METDQDIGFADDGLRISGLRTFLCDASASLRLCGESEIYSPQRTGERGAYAEKESANPSFANPLMLKPSSSPEHKHHPHRHYQHQAHRNKKSVLMVQVRDAVEVHAEDAADNRGRGQ